MAFYPYKTYSGASFPIQNVTVEGAVAAGDVLKAHGTDQQWTKIAGAGDDGPLAVAMHAAADEGSCAICIATPDVLFRTTVQSGTPLTGQAAAVDNTTMDLGTYAAEVDVMDIRFAYIGGSVVIDGTTYYVGQLLPAFDNA